MSKFQETLRDINENSKTIAKKLSTIKSEVNLILSMQDQYFQIDQLKQLLERLLRIVQKFFAIASSATSEEASFDPVVHSTATAFTQRRSPTRSTSHSSTSDENPFEITILPRSEDQYRNSTSEKTPLPRQRIRAQGTNIMATANTTIREALSQATDPATSKTALS
ncbi:hypothetical protein ABEB36_013514 [Hypothenemus hampei]|uniref:Uncharacterized protein n=1 Tax=Hypothenemus hampei TaxID=57062 RepID=A0ABD1E4F4_HYPHA